MRFIVSYLLVLANLGFLTLGAHAAVPLISVAPVGQRATVGASAAFSVEASGSGTLSYAWFKDGALVAGATSARLFIEQVRSADAGSYQVKVSNGDGTVESTTASLVVNATATITSSLSASVPLVGPVAGRLTLGVELNYASEAAPTSLGFSLSLPPGWEYVSTGGADAPDLALRGRTILPCQPLVHAVLSVTHRLRHDQAGCL